MDQFYSLYYDNGFMQPNRFPWAHKSMNQNENCDQSADFVFTENISKILDKTLNSQISIDKFNIYSKSLKQKGHHCFSSSS